MFASLLNGVELRSIVSAVPSSIEYTTDSPLFTDKQAENFIKSTGIVSRRVANKTTCASDLCFVSAEALIKKLGWAKESINLLIHITQSPDRQVPATSIMLQHRLGLSHDVAAFDINLGCSSYPYGYYVISSLLQTQPLGSRALLTIGDLSSRLCDPCDSSTAPLFSDVGTASAFELTSRETHSYFSFFSDGSGADAITITADGLASRDPSSSPYLQMNGPDVFSFAIQKVPRLIINTLERAGLHIEDINSLVLHQANMFINSLILKKIHCPDRISLASIADYGNTSSASIPHTLAASFNSSLHAGKLLMAGFGVGLSWSAGIVQLPLDFCPTLIQVDL